MELRQVERYWETRVELVFALKEDASSSLMVVLQFKTEVPEGVYVVDVEGASHDEPMAKGYTPAAASLLSPMLPLFCYAQATQTILASLEASPDFEPLRIFELCLQEEYRGSHRDQMQRIQDFRR